MLDTRCSSLRGQVTADTTDKRERRLNGLMWIFWLFIFFLFLRIRPDIISSAEAGIFILTGNIIFSILLQWFILEYLNICICYERIELCPLNTGAISLREHILPASL